ncbi:hypothetical protein PROFUN_14445 [Planoprotostelium fungivorum]|uniref:Uncharacterized protein n=1 Tax=Planoprotostelium fungivorum TaxID=1890364 RepID=A0A2P6MX77_9EUKA|nr:hypothetical protein PROFUN_14445 [Planoprotostelium fungivorum]
MEWTHVWWSRGHFYRFTVPWQYHRTTGPHPKNPSVQYRNIQNLHHFVYHYLQLVKDHRTTGPHPKKPSQNSRGFMTNRYLYWHGKEIALGETCTSESDPL